MARSPQQLMEHLLKTHANEVAGIESVIEGEIARQSYPVHIQAKGLGLGALREAIIDSYRKAGWDVKEHYESGDYTDSGYHYYEFRPKKTKGE